MVEAVSDGGSTPPTSTIIELKKVSTYHKMGQMIETDVLVVGAGPAGLAAAIALKRGSKKRGDVKSPRVVVLEKGRSIGSHVLSGAIIDPSGFEGLLTADEIEKLPVEAKVVKESFRRATLLPVTLTM